jgi:hypothetical protein
MEYLEQRFVHMLEMLREAKMQRARSSSSPLFLTAMECAGMHATGENGCKWQKCVQEAGMHAGG